MRTAIMRGKRLGHESDEQQSSNSWRWVLLLCAVQIMEEQKGGDFDFDEYSAPSGSLNQISSFWRWEFSEQKLNSEEGFPSAPPCCVPAARRETRSYRWRSLVELPCWSVFLQSCWAPRWHLSCFVHRITVTATSVMATFSTWPLCKHDPPAAESHPAVPPHQNVSDKCFSACSGGYTSWNRDRMEVVTNRNQQEKVKLWKHQPKSLHWLHRRNTKLSLVTWETSAASSLRSSCLSFSRLIDT